MNLFIEDIRRNKLKLTTIIYFSQIGVLRLFCCGYEGIHLIKVVNEDLPEECRVVDIQSSNDADFIAATVESK